MKNFDILTLINENDKNTITEMIEKEGKFKTLSSFSQILDKRAYVTIDTLGNIKRKNGSMALPMFAFFDESSVLADVILKYSDLKERQIIDKIERFSNTDTKKVRENLVKTIFNGNLDFAKKYGKELFMRDRNDFYNLIATFVVIGNSSSLKSLFLLAFKKIMENMEYDGNIFFLFISFITKYRDNTSYYEACNNDNYTVETIKNLLKENENVLNSTLGLGILCNLNIIENFDIPNKDKVLSKIAFEIKSYESLTELSQEEQQLLKLFL